MSSIEYATPLSLELKPSRTLFRILTLMHLGAAGMLFATSLPGWTTACVLVLVLGSYMSLVARHALLRVPGSVRWLRWDKGNHWRVCALNGNEYSASLRPDSFVSPWLTVLLLRPESGGRLRNVVLLPDMLDAEAFRHLRVRLRLEQAILKGDQPEALG